MNKTIKIIDLLNKIANGEKVPKKIKVSCYTFEWQEEGRYYKDINATYIHSLLQDWLNNANKLNSEAEIIEDNTEEIEELDPNDCYFKDGTELVYKLMFNKINELVRAVNQIRKEKE